MALSGHWRGSQGAEVLGILDRGETFRSEAGWGSVGVETEVPFVALGKPGGGARFPENSQP